MAQQMQAICAKDEKLILCDRIRPLPNADEILVKIHAFGVNRADLLQRRGNYAPPAGVTDILGLECAGEIIECGEHVQNWKVGDRVFGLVPGGAYAEYVAIHQNLALAVPENASFVEAAGFMEAACTAHETLFELGQLKKDETLLLAAAASGVGTMAIQMALYRGAHVIGLVGSDEKIEKLKHLNSTLINYKTENISARVKILTRDQGVDVIEDFVGGDRFIEHLSLLKKGGRLVQVAMMGGRHSSIDLLLLVRNYLQIKGFVLRNRSLAEKTEFVKHVREYWWPVFEKRQILPVIHRVFNAMEAQAAHAELESNSTVGKIVLVW